MTGAFRQERSKLAPDFLVAQRLVIELKTVGRIAPVHLAQALSYLKAFVASARRSMRLPPLSWTYTSSDLRVAIGRRGRLAAAPPLIPLAEPVGHDQQRWKNETRHNP